MTVSVSVSVPFIGKLLYQYYYLTLTTRALVLQSKIVFVFSHF